MTDEYPEYEVQFNGVGYPDLQPNAEGPCSQVMSLALMYWHLNVN